MATAIITSKPYSRLVAGLTRHTFSSMSSWVGTPGDGIKRISRVLWTFPDGTFSTDRITQFRFPGAGPRVLSLTVWGDDSPGGEVEGTPNTTSITLNIAATPNWGMAPNTFRKYVRSDGNDANSGNGNTSATAYQHIDKAFAAWRNTNPFNPGTPYGVVFINADDTVNCLGTTPDPDTGPLMILKTGVGANPVIHIPAGVEFSLGYETHNNDFSHSVIVDGIDLTYDDPQDPNGLPPNTGKVTVFRVGCGIYNSTITNSKLEVHEGGFVGYNLTITGAADVGFAVSAPDGAFNCFENCNAIGNGVDAILDHGFYFTCCDNCGVNGTLVDQDGADAFSGMKFSLSHDMSVSRCTVKDCYVGFDGGGNQDEPVLNIAYNRIIMDNCLHAGWIVNNVQNMSVRNVRAFGGLAYAWLWENHPGAYGDDEIAQDLDVFNCSLYMPVGMVARFESSRWRDWDLKNIAVIKDTGTGYFYELIATADAPHLHTFNNQYFKVGATEASTGFAHVGANNRSFTTWVSADGQEDGAGADFFDDPLFSSSTDLTLLADSPCRDRGLSIGVTTRDAIDQIRPLGPGYDIGALERAGVDETMEVLATEMLIVPETVGFKHSMPIASATMHIVGNDVTLSNTTVVNDVMDVESATLLLQTSDVQLIYVPPPQPVLPQTPAVTPSRGRVRFVPFRLPNGRIIWRIQ